MKNITIAGNIGKDANLRTTNQGNNVANFSVAVEHRDGQNKSTMWFDVSLWGRRGEALAGYLTKGTKVAVSGDFSTREYNGSTYFQVRANDVTLMGGGHGSNSGGSQGVSGGQSGSFGAGGDLDDSIPFMREDRL